MITMGSYGMKCLFCPWTVDRVPTTEQLERLYVAHVREQHSEAFEKVSADALAGDCRPRVNFDTTRTAEGYQTTCSACRATKVTPDEEESDAWLPIHARECQGWPMTDLTVVADTHNPTPAP